MSLEKEVKKHTPADWKGLKGSGGNFPFFQKVIDPYIDSLSILDNPIGEVTSRDQIINPHELIDATLYQNTVRGRARYNQDLERAKLYAQQQEAAYKEWYESPEQSAIREREAGRNPDLLDSLDSQAASTQMPEGGAFDDIPTNGQIALDAIGSAISGISSIASVISSVGSVMATIDQISVNDSYKNLLKNQSDGQFLSNIQSFILSASNSISDSLAKAMSNESFDMDKFFSGGFDDVYSSLAPSDRVLNHSKKVHTDAYSSLANHENRRSEYLSRLSSGYYSTDDDEMIGQLSIIVGAEEQMDLVLSQASAAISAVKMKYANLIDVESAASEFNSESEYQSEYYKAMDGELVAIVQQAIQQANSVITGASADVQNYLRRQFNSPINLFFPERKSRIGWQIVAGANMGWQDHMYGVANKGFNLILDEIVSRSQFNRASASSTLTQAAAATVQADAASQNAVTNAARVDIERRRVLQEAIQMGLKTFVPWF